MWRSIWDIVTDMKNRGLALLVLLICLCVAVSDAWAARRLGGGSSIGRQRDSATLQRAPAPLPPAAAPAGPGYAPGMAPRPAPGAGFAPPPARNRWLGPLAGFAGGALLGSLLFGHGGGFGLGSLILPLLLIGGFIFLLRRFMSAATPPTAAAPAGAWRPVAAQAPTPDWNPAPGRTMNGTLAEGGALAGAVVTAGTVGSVGALPPPARPDMILPAEFDLPGFLRQAKLAFVRMQAANDAADLADLREFTTPQMYAELALQIGERGAAAQRVDVLALEAGLLDLTTQAEESVASVQFQGTLRENGGAPEAFSEIWHVRRRLDQANSPWLLAGIQQLV